MKDSENEVYLSIMRGLNEILQDVRGQGERLKRTRYIREVENTEIRRKNIKA